jgi:hypothetical protein
LATAIVDRVDETTMRAWRAHPRAAAVCSQQEEPEFRWQAVQMVAFREDNLRPERDPLFGMCDHLFDTTSRYDRERRLLTFVLFCPACETETVVETLRYAPAFRQGDALGDRDGRR